MTNAVVWSASELVVDEHSESSLTFPADTVDDHRRLVDFQRAMLNILEDAADSQHSRDDTYHAMLNILSDAREDQQDLRDGQRAVVNLLEDLADEKGRLDTINRALAREVDERRRSELELQQSTDMLARSNADLETFAYAASHDLSEPLRAIAGPLELFSRRHQRELPKEDLELLRFANDGCLRMQAIIDGLLEFSRIGRLEAATSSVDMAELLASVLDGLSAAVQEAKAVVRIGPMPVLHTEPRQLAIVFQNLVANAVKFRHPDRRPEIDVTASRELDVWRFAVVDNGIGIDPRHRDQVFGMFKRLHAWSSYAGSGIGLALVKKIVERHGGRVGVEDNTSGTGCAFWFTLPAEQG